MEYRSSLNRYGFGFIVVWTLIIGSLTTITIRSGHQNTISEAEAEARDYFLLNLQYRAWAAKMGSIYVPAEKVTPNQYLQVPNRDIVSSDGRQLTLVNPAFMTRMVFESIRSSSPDPIINRITSLKPLNPANAPDDWERRSLAALERKEYQERSEVTSITGKPYVRFISAVVTDEPCLPCHAHQGYRVGDVRGAIVVSVPLSKRLVQQAENDRSTLGRYLVLWVLGVAGIVYTSRRRFINVEQLTASEQKFRTVCDWTQDWEYWLRPDGKIKYMSPSCKEATGYTQDEFLRDPELILRIVHDDFKQLFRDHLFSRTARQDQPAEMIEFQIKTRTGELRWIQHVCRLIFDGDIFLGRRASNRDITQQKQDTDKIRLNESRLSRLVGILQFPCETIQAFLDNALNEAIQLTGSRFGYINFYNEGSQEFVQNSWSKDVSKACTVVRPHPVYHLDTTGIWGESVRQRKPIVLNDYAAANPLKKGCPEGHVAMRNFMAVPVFSNDKIVAVVGMANKPVDYDDTDVLQLTLLMDAVWKFVENKQSEQKLWEGEEKYRRLVEDLGSDFFFYRHGTDGVFTYVSPGITGMLGYTPNEFLCHYSEHLTDNPLNKEAEQYSILCMQGVKPPAYELELYHKDGTVRWLEVTESPVIESNGQIMAVEGIAHDITARKRAEESIRESNELFSVAFNNAPLMFTISCLDDGNYIDVNQQFLDCSGFTRDEVIGKTSIELGWITEADRALLRESIVQNGRIQNYELTLHAKTGLPVLCKFWGEIITIAGQKRLLSIALDVTGYRKIEQQLLQAQKMESIGQLAGGVAHDFNNMLCVIIGHADIGLQDETLTDSQRRHLELILNAANRSAGITKQLLAFARRQNIEPKVIDLNDALSGMLKMINRLIGENIELVWTPGHALHKVNIDPAQVDQLLANLCVNARDAISGIGNIIIHTENTKFSVLQVATLPDIPPGEYVTLSVSDTGQGMASDVLSHIFEPFYTTKALGKGTGLGLATVYGIVKQNQGAITVESEPGCGTTFRIYLPAVNHEPSTAPVHENDQITGGSENILLVEDELEVMEMVTSMLISLGYHVLHASSPVEAMQIAEKECSALHLLITDMVMPGMSGSDLAQQIQPLNQHIKCLFISGYTSDLIDQVIKDGMHFLPKPFTQQELARKVREVLDADREQNSE